MIEIKQINLHELSEKLKADVRPLVLNDFQCSFDSPNLPGSGDFISIAALADGKPIGILLSTFDRVLFRGEVLSLNIQENYRRQRIATKLLAELKNIMKNLRCGTCTLKYSSKIETRPYIEKLFHQAGWHGPLLLIQQYLFDGFSFNPPWLDKPFTLPAGFEEFPWKEISEQDRESIKHQLSQGRIPPSVYPLREEELIEPLNSLGLRYKEDIVGWMITHRIATDTIRFSALYIHREFQFREAWIKLLMDAINIQRRSFVQWALLEIIVSQADLAWQSFVERRLKPYAQSVTDVLQMWINYRD